MKVSMARSTVHEILEKEGFRRVLEPGSSEIWGKLGTDVIPFFAPDIIRKGRNIEVLGGVGVYLTNFESSWVERLNKHYPKKKFVYSSLLGSYLTNFKKFMAPPAFYQDPTSAEMLEKQWIRDIIHFLNDFPNDMDALLTGLGNGVVGSHPARLFLGHRVKWLAFLRWLEENSFKFSNTLHEMNHNRRIEPYEEIFQELST